MKKLKIQQLNQLNKFSILNKKITKLQKKVIKTPSKINFPVLSLKKLATNTESKTQFYKSTNLTRNNSRKFLPSFTSIKHGNSKNYYSTNTSSEGRDPFNRFKQFSSSVSPINSKSNKNNSGHYLCGKKYLKGNDDSDFSINEIKIKDKEDWNTSQVLHKSPTNFNTNKNNNEISKKESEKNIIDNKNTNNNVEKNQKMIFNNFDIHYYNPKKKVNEESKLIKQGESEEIIKLKGKITHLLQKNCTLENENSEKETKIIYLKERIKKLEDYIKTESENKKNNEIEKNNLLSKIEALEKNLTNLKNENENLKKEIDNKNKPVASLSSNHLKINNKRPAPKNSVRSIISFAEEIKFIKIKDDCDAKNNIDSISSSESKDIQKLNMISLDPDKI